MDDEKRKNGTEATETKSDGDKAKEKDGKSEFFLSVLVRPINSTVEGDLMKLSFFFFQN